MNREFLKDTKRVVIKVGTNSIMESPLEVDFEQINRIAYVCSELMKEGYEVILVTSGAVGVGASIMKLEEYPKSIQDQQALSTIGQTTLMSYYSQAFNSYDQIIGQLLFTKDVLDFPVSYETMQKALSKLIEKKIVPIINENDATSVDELNHQTRFGDNDTLSAFVARIVDADLLIILSDIDGLYDANPDNHPSAKLIEHLPEITADIKQMASGKGSEFSRGGMSTKLDAAEIMLEDNKPMVIASGEDSKIIFEVLNGKNIGTLFYNKNHSEEG